MPKGVYARKPADERFDAQVGRPGEHHLWIGSIGSEGYGAFWLDGRYVGAHVYAWTRVHGPLAPGQVVRHQCRERLCVRLDHLETGTKADNNRDRQRDGTQTRGSAHHSSKLTEEQVEEAQALRALGLPWPRIGALLGVPANRIREAATHHNGTWLHVEAGLTPERLARAAARLVG